MTAPTPGLVCVGRWYYNGPSLRPMTCPSGPSPFASMPMVKTGDRVPKNQNGIKTTETNSPCQTEEEEGLDHHEEEHPLPLKRKTARQEEEGLPSPPCDELEQQHSYVDV